MSLPTGRPIALCLWLLLLGLTPGSSAAPGEATVTLTGLFLRVTPATTRILGNPYTVSFSSTDDETLNHEFYNSGGTVLYSSVARIDYPGSEALGPIIAAVDVAIPEAGDTNVNGITDFMEVSRSISATTEGELLVDDGMEVSRGTLEATWSREAGVASGTVQLRVNLPDFGIQNLVFNHPFEIFHYRGIWTYSVSGSQLDGQVSLPRVGAPGFLTGAFPALRLSATELQRAPTVLTNQDPTEFEVLGTLDIEDVPFPIQYVAGPFYAGILVLADGDPSTPFTDEYDFFDLLVEDRNDTDGDGLPDLSDATVSPPATRPVLTLIPGAAGLRVRLQGTAGASCTVETSASLAVPDWLTAGNVTLDAQGLGEVELPASSDPARFYRARTP